MDQGETIVAISSAVGAAVRMIVRLSGPKAMDLLAEVLAGEPIASPGVHHTAIGTPGSLGIEATIPAWVYVFRGPRSYTGDDLVELHLPGNPLLVRMVVEELTRLGARGAEPGEFTARAYLNGRLDLAAAEGVAMTIAAGNVAELRAARQLLSGELSRRLQPLMEQTAEALALLEAGIDFVEEDISFISSSDLLERIGGIETGVRSLLDQTSRFERLSHEPRFALVGRPNAGKSTLLNALAGHERAVVSPMAGTTRDALSAQVAIDGGVVTLIDVAGLETIEDDPHGLNAQMQAKAIRTLEEAEHVLHVIDLTDNQPPTALPRPADLVVYNKADLRPASTVAGIAVSASRGDGLPALRTAMSALAFGRTESSTLALNARHLQALEECLLCLARARAAIAHGGAEMIALDLREALDALGRVLGQVTPDDVLGRIFGSFCIGK